MKCLEGYVEVSETVSANYQSKRFTVGMRYQVTANPHEDHEIAEVFVTEKLKKAIAEWT